MIVLLYVSCDSQTADCAILHICLAASGFCCYEIHYLFYPFVICFTLLVIV